MKYNVVVSYSAIILALGSSTFNVQANGLPEDIGFLTNSQRVSFAQLPYDANKKDPSLFQDHSSQLLADGWQVKKLQGTTGSLDKQVESTMGTMAFKGHKVVISTRGTEATNINDWATNLRYNINGAFSGLLSPLRDSQYHNKEAQRAAQFLPRLNGEVHNGFLQTHISMWDEIKDTLQSYAAAQGVQVSDLEIETTGHSLGGALQDLNQAHLLSDSILGYGVTTLQDSFVDNDLGMSFVGVKNTAPKANTQVRGTAFEAPRAMTQEAGQNFDAMVGRGNSPHVMNKNDFVPSVPFNVLGYVNVGDAVNVDNGYMDPKNVHVLKTVGPVAVPALDEFDAQKIAAQTTTATVNTPKTWKETLTGPFVKAGQAVSNAARKVASWFGY